MGEERKSIFSLGCGCLQHPVDDVSTDAGGLLWYAMVSQQFPETLPVQTVKCFLIINKRRESSAVNLKELKSHITLLGLHWLK